MSAAALANTADDFVNFPQSIRLNDTRELSRLAELDARGAWSLARSEIWFRDRQTLFASQGYILRPRFRLDWTPSWRGTNIIPYFCEDSHPNLLHQGIDASRANDGQAVFIKKIRRSSLEYEIAQYLYSEDKRHDINNHCVPVLDYFEDEADPNIALMVMPLLRAFNDPPFVFVDEVTDFFRQTLEGLVFMHRQNVAHRDLSDLNIMMDASHLYPDGVHPTASLALPSGRGTARYLNRADVPSIRYYFTDFGIATRFKNANEPRLVTGMDAQDKTVPELSADIPYDPFLVDIYTLGNVYKRHFTDIYSNIPFLAPLVDAMTQNSPKLRPTAVQALDQFKDILSNQTGSMLRRRLQKPTDTFSQRVSKDIHSDVRETIFVLKKLADNPHLLTSLLLALPGSILWWIYGRQAIFNRLRAIFNR